MTGEQKAKIVEYRGQGCSYKGISEILGISINTVTSFCRRAKLDGISAEIKAVVHCKNCGRLIKSKTGCKPKTFCSDACRQEWWNTHLEQVNRKAVYTFICLHCGRQFTAYGNQRRKYCSHGCYIADRFGKEGNRCEG